MIQKNDFEETWSFAYRFHDWDIVVPGPGDGWGLEKIELVPMSLAGLFCHVEHHGGKLIAKEYERRFWSELEASCKAKFQNLPAIINVIKWTKPHETKPENPESYSAIKNYPLLWGEV